METWTSDVNRDWQRWSHTVLGLDAVARATPAVSRLFVIANTQADDDELLAAIRIARALAGGPLEIVAGCAYPSAGWVVAARQAGADGVLFVPERTDRDREHEAPRVDTRPLDERVCPELRAKHAGSGVLSVCGAHYNRMVLTQAHLERWCLTARDQCPHWQECCGR